MRHTWCRHNITINCFFPVCHAKVIFRNMWQVSLCCELPTATVNKASLVFNVYRQWHLSSAAAFSSYWKFSFTLNKILKYERRDYNSVLFIN